jgi:rod shape-determining protein MreD
MAIRRSETQLFWISWLLALALTLWPGPPWFLQLKPFWFGLLAVYWALESPQRMTLGRAFLFGLLADAVQGVLIGEQALRLTILVYICLRFRFRLRFFAIGQQAAAVLALFVNDRVLSLWVRLLGGYGWPDPGFWLAPISAAILWPWLFLLLDRARRYERSSS